MDANVVRTLNEGPMGPQGPVKVNNCIMNNKAGFTPVVRVYNLENFVPNIDAGGSSIVVPDDDDDNEGDDTVTGGSGTDTTTGGDDSVTGGDSTDTEVINTGDGTDTVTIEGGTDILKSVEPKAGWGSEKWVALDYNTGESTIVGINYTNRGTTVELGAEDVADATALGLGAGHLVVWVKADLAKTEPATFSLEKGEKKINVTVTAVDGE